MYRWGTYDANDNSTPTGLVVEFLDEHDVFIESEQLDEESPCRNYEAAREGKISAAEMREVYAENLEYVVQAATELIENIEGKVVLTAYDGELLGEGMPLWMKACHNRWGNQWHKHDFGHYCNVNVPELMEMSWLEMAYDHRRDIKSEESLTDEYHSEYNKI